MRWMRAFAKCRTCSMLSVLIGISAILITTSFFILGYSIYKVRDISEAKRELAEVKKEYESVTRELKKLQNFSPEQYEAISRRSYADAREALGIFQNIFIAAAMLATRNGTPEDAIAAWKQALYLNPESRICNYGLGMEYFKAGINDKAEKEHERECLEQAVKYLSDKSLYDDPQAQYHLAIASLRIIDRKRDRQAKYEKARSAIAVLENTDPGKQPLGNVARNLAYAYCLAARYAPDPALSMNYKRSSAEYFAEIKGLKDFEYFYEKHYQNCVK